MTHYMLAASARDYAKAQDLVKAEGLPRHTLSFPTVLAWKDGELTGLLSTYIQKDLIVAGPLVLRSGQKRYWTLIRLIENYELVMRTVGVTSYIFSVEEDNQAWLDKIDDVFHLEPYATQDGRNFYVRKL